MFVLSMMMGDRPGHGTKIAFEKMVY